MYEDDIGCFDGNRCIGRKGDIERSCNKSGRIIDIVVNYGYVIVGFIKILDNFGFVFGVYVRVNFVFVDIYLLGDCLSGSSSVICKYGYFDIYIFEGMDGLSGGWFGGIR